MFTSAISRSSPHPPKRIIGTSFYFLFASPTPWAPSRRIWADPARRARSATASERRGFEAPCHGASRPGTPAAVCALRQDALCDVRELCDLRALREALKNKTLGGRVRRGAPCVPRALQADSRRCRRESRSGSSALSGRTASLSRVPRHLDQPHRL